MITNGQVFREMDEYGTLRDCVFEALDIQRKALIEEFVYFLIDLKHNYNHEGESYKQIENKLQELKNIKDLISKNEVKNE